MKLSRLSPEIIITSKDDRRIIPTSLDGVYYITKSRIIKRIEINGEPNRAYNEMRAYLESRRDSGSLHVCLIER